MVEVKRKKGESFEAFLRRFKKRVIESRVIMRAQEKRFRQREFSKNKVKTMTLRRLSITGQKEYLRKIGKLKDEDGYRY